MASQHALGEKFTTFYLPNCDTNGFYKTKQVSVNVKTLQKCIRSDLHWRCGSIRSYDRQVTCVYTCVSNTVRDVPRRTGCTLLVCVRLEWEEDHRIQWCPRRCPLPPGDHSLSPAALLTHTYTQAEVHLRKKKKSTFLNQDWLKKYCWDICFQHRA